jgi:xylan 1,4-beta-xylosidase
VIKALFDLQDRYKVNLISMLSWSFEFEGKEYFEGFRTLATNGVDKPVLNVFRMAGLMSGNRVSTSSTGQLSLDQILKEGGARRRISASKASGHYDVEWTD